MTKNKKKRGMRMKSSIKKLFAMCAAVSAITAVTAMSASASGLTAKSSADGSSVTVSVSSGATAVTGETTILLLKGDYTDGTKTTVDDADILYINQDDAETAQAAGGFLAADGVLPKENLVDGETYTIRVADETGSFIHDVVFTVGAESDIKYGDVNLDDKIDARDALAIVDHFLKKSLLTGDALVAANVNADSTVDARDALMVVDYFLKKIDSFPASK